MQGDFVEQGLQLMLFGMGTVLLFLSLLVLATLLMSHTVNRFFPQAPEPVAQASRGGKQTAVHDPRHIAAVSAAVHRYRSEQR